MWKLGSKKVAWFKLKSHLVTFVTLFGCRRANLSGKIDIPKFDQNYQKCKGFSQGNFWQGLVMSSNLILPNFIPISTLLCFQNTIMRKFALLMWRKSIKVVEVGVQKCSGKIDIPKFDQSHQKCKGFSQGNFWQGLVMTSSLIPSNFIPISPLLCFQNTGQNEKISSLDAKKVHQSCGS